MGGRMSGESPREKKAEMRDCGSGAVLPHQVMDTGDVVIAITATQASRQQPALCNPLGQQDFCAASAVSEVLWQSDCINCGPAKATTDPCRPMAIITIKAMS